jgi:hypothetical protein
VPKPKLFRNGGISALTGTDVRPGVTRVGTVGAYTTGSDLELVRHVRGIVGRVTVCGKPGLRALASLAKADDLYGVDLDPAGYLGRDSGQGELFGIAWEAEQRRLALPVVRSAGVFVNKADHGSLKKAFSVAVDPGTVRVVSLHGRWLERGCSRDLLHCVKGCDDQLAFVLAEQFDPLAHPGSVDGLCALLNTAGAGGRWVELLRTDATGVAFAALGGSLGAVGLSTTTRHHGLPLGKRAGKEYKRRRSVPYVFVRPLLSWQKGTALGALTPFGGAGITDCDCDACMGRDLRRFDREWPGVVPPGIRADAREHDLQTWMALANDVLGAADPVAAWHAACNSAVATASNIASTYKVQLTVPQSVSGWL